MVPRKYHASRRNCICVSFPSSYFNLLPTYRRGHNWKMDLERHKAFRLRESITPDPCLLYLNLPLFSQPNNSAIATFCVPIPNPTFGLFPHPCALRTFTRPLAIIAILHISFFILPPRPGRVAMAPIA